MTKKDFIVYLKKISQMIYSGIYTPDEVGEYIDKLLEKEKNGQDK